MRWTTREQRPEATSICALLLLRYYSAPKNYYKIDRFVWLIVGSKVRRWDRSRKTTRKTKDTDRSNYKYLWFLFKKGNVFLINGNFRLPATPCFDFLFRLLVSTSMVTFNTINLLPLKRELRHSAAPNNYYNVCWRACFAHACSEDAARAGGCQGWLCEFWLWSHVFLRCFMIFRRNLKKKHNNFHWKYVHFRRLIIDEIRRHLRVRRSSWRRRRRSCWSTCRAAKPTKGAARHFQITYLMFSLMFRENLKK